MMKKNKTSPFDPLTRKTFRAALKRELLELFPQAGGLLADAAAGRLESLFDEYHPPTERFRPGQMLWPAIDEHETAGYGKRIEECKVKPVVLRVRTDEDIRDKLAGERAKTIRQNVTVRLFEDAKRQGGVLTQVDVAAILGLSPATISRYVRERERETGAMIPRRGTVHDMGPSVTHKREICRMVIVEGRTIEQTARDTRHSPEAVTRYVQDFRRVYACLEYGLSVDQTAFTAKMSKKLVGEYKDLIGEKREGEEESCVFSERYGNDSNR